MAWIVVILVFLGLFNLIAPRAAWFVSVGWKFRNAEPSNAYLILHRIGGGVACIVAVVILTVGTWHAGDSASRERVIRADLATDHLESITLQGKLLSLSHEEELVGWIRESAWEKPDIDYSKQNRFVSAAELDFHYSSGQVVEVFRMGEGQFGIGEKVFYPEYVFRSSELEKWFAVQK